VETVLTGEQRRAAIVLMLLASCTAIALAPLALPASYSWVRHTTSESAAQGLEGAWIARTGFLLFGLAVIWLASDARPRWGRLGSTLLGTFGVMMLGTAAYSHRPWLPNVPFDPFEDLLHSATATIMGFAFAAGVIVVGLRRRAASTADRAIDSVAVGASVLIPLVMMQGTGYTGLFQRSMFLIAYLWYGRETLSAAL